MCLGCCGEAGTGIRADSVVPLPHTTRFERWE